MLPRFHLFIVRFFHAFADRIFPVLCSCSGSYLFFFFQIFPVLFHVFRGVFCDPPPRRWLFVAERCPGACHAVDLSFAPRSRKTSSSTEVPGHKFRVPILPSDLHQIRGDGFLLCRERVLGFPSAWTREPCAPPAARRSGSAGSGRDSGSPRRRGGAGSGDGPPWRQPKGKSMIS